MSDIRNTSSSFELTEMIHHMHEELDRILCSVESEAEREVMRDNLARFKVLFAQYIEESGHKIDWDGIQPLDSSKLLDQASLPPPDKSRISEYLSKLVVVKLNGGLGTSMGCVGPKSTITVRDDKSFLDLCVRQIEFLNNTFSVSVPLILMNSFYTEEETGKLLRKYEHANCKIFTFNQSRFPRIYKSTLRPMPSNNSKDSEWYPPGHGDFYQTFYGSGLLEKLKAEGKEWVFLSNIDNLGATVDLSILQHVLLQGDACDFVMEVTNKTRADVKGGTLVHYRDRVRLLEVAQVPKNKMEEFKSISKFRIFNTNNLWVKLGAIESVLKSNNLSMEVIENSKTLDGGQQIIQLEQAVGSAIGSFKGAIGVNVSRSRFLPVKKTSDLLLVMSNLYELSHGCLKLSEKRQFEAPLIKLGDLHFAKVKQFLQRFETIPNIMELDHLTVSGDVVFGRDVTLKGTVIIIASENQHIDIPAGSILENKIVSGHLRIMDH